MSDDARLAAMLTRVLRAPSPFYRQRLAEAALSDPARVALGELPLTWRRELVTDQLGHLPLGTRRFADAASPIRVGQTGTGADLLVLAWSAADLAREVAAGARLLGHLGIGAGSRVANNLPGALATPGALLLGDVVEHLGALDVPLGATESEAAARTAWELADLVEPEILILEPSSAAILFAAAPDRQRPWWQGVVWLRCGPGASPRPRVPRGAEPWQREWLAVPEATSFVAHSCAAAHFHVDEAVAAEVVDGVLVLTPLGGDMPVLRYVSDAGARLVGAPCRCGEPGTVLEVAPSDGSAAA
jgi:phenylacetate-coenzyme A ligase PaaK-like adenylate-forming protein